MKKNNKPSQCERIIQYLIDFGSITQLQALQDLGCMRLASRINELRKRGYSISSKYIQSVNRYGEEIRYKEYRLINE